ncbi:hypothetical protein ACET3Z_010151 [Daucus carota]
MKPPGCDIANNKKGSLRLDDWVLCRIYKKNNSQRPLMEHESCDSMGDMILGSIKSEPCVQIGQQHPKLPGSYGAMLENEQSMLQSAPNLASLMSMKRGLFWEEDGGPSLANKRFLTADHQNDEEGKTVQDDNGSISMASFLGQFPQSTQADEAMHQQGPMLGNLGDGAYREQHFNQLQSNMNWYT